MDEQESPFICKICYSNYDEDNKKPVIISPCSHTICKSCLTEILSLNKACPFCKKEIKGDIDEIKPNYELVDIINQLRNSNNSAYVKCPSCKEEIKNIFLEEKNSNISFLCDKCAKSFNNANITSLDSLIKDKEEEIENYKSLLNKKINIKSIKDEICKLITDYLKKTLCELIDQKRELIESFLELPDFLKSLEKYKNNIENILNSKQNSLEFISQNSKMFTPTIKDSMINNILNLKNQNTNEKLETKINYLEQTIEKEFNKNKLYLQSILQTLTNEIIYQSNIAVYNTFKESLKDDISLLEKITMSGSILNKDFGYGSLSSNFQHNHIKFGTISSQMQLQQQLNNLELESNPAIYNKNTSNNNKFINIISENNTVSIVGLIKDKHNDINKFINLLNKNFKCKSKLYDKDKVYYGCQLTFDSRRDMDEFLIKKNYVVEFDSDKKVKFFKKENKFGNRLYVKYL